VLAQTLFLIAMLAIFAASAIAGVAGVARTQSVGAARALIVPGVETALSRYQRYIATTIGAQISAPGGDALSAPSAIPALSGSAAWNAAQYLETAGGDSSLQIAVDVRPTAQTVPTCASASSGPDTAVALQCSPFVQESRLSLAVTSDAGPVDAHGTVSPLAHGRYTVTLRLFAEPPYVAISGVKDAADPNGYHEGDVAGYGNALPSFASPSPDDTTIHVVYQCTDGTGSCATSNPPPQDAPTAVPWTNGNGRP
jgi:hypothetical protein